MTNTSADLLERFEPLFAPKTVAVIGASATAMTHGNVFIRRMREFGYAGTMYPIHPSAQTIEGLPAFRSLGETPQPIRLSLSQRLTGQVANGDLARANFAGDYTPKILRTETIGGALLLYLVKRDRRYLRFIGQVAKFALLVLVSVLLFFAAERLLAPMLGPLL